MNLFGMMDLTGSALTAERVRAEVVASNMANAETTRTATGGPYQRQHVVFQTVDQEFAQTMQSMGASSGPTSGMGGMMSGSSSMGSLSGSGVTPGGVEIGGIVADTSAPVE